MFKHKFFYYYYNIRKQELLEQAVTVAELPRRAGNATEKVARAGTGTYNSDFIPPCLPC